jgi:hypothetical protein
LAANECGASALLTAPALEAVFLALAAKLNCLGEEMAEQEGLKPVAREPDRSFESLPAPVGTLFVLTVYLAILVGMWGVMFWGLLGRHG